LGQVLFFWFWRGVDGELREAGMGVVCKRGMKWWVGRWHSAGGVGLLFGLGKLIVVGGRDRGY